MVGGAECQVLLQGIILAADVYDQLMSTVKRDVTVSHCLQIVTAYLLLCSVYCILMQQCVQCCHKDQLATNQ